MNTQDLDSGPGAGAKNSFIDPIMSLTVEEKVTLLSFCSLVISASEIGAYSHSDNQLSQWHQAVE
jgi:hypothetical protein